MESSERQHITFEVDGEQLDFDVIVGSIERRHEPAPDILGGDRIGLDASVKLAAPGGQAEVTFFLSRLVGEPFWIIDAKIGANGFPHFSHGFGSRVTVAKTLADEICDLLDVKAKRLGLVRAIGRDIPMELAA